MSAFTKAVKVAERGEKLIPLLKKFLNEERLKNSGNGAARREVDIQDALMTIDCFKDRLSERRGENEENAKKARVYFHPSAIGICMRQLWFGHKNAPVGKVNHDEALREHLTFEMGTYIHVMFQNLCKRAGMLEHREFLVIDDKLKIIGHCDGVLKIEGEKVLLEIKTINERGFAQLSKGPHESHKRQATMYMATLGIKSACIVYINKNRHEVKEFYIPYDDVLYRKTILPRKDFYFRAIQSNMPPPREGITPNEMPCLYCPFKVLCFEEKTLAKFLAQLKPSRSILKLNFRKAI